MLIGLEPNCLDMGSEPKNLQVANRRAAGTTLIFVFRGRQGKQRSQTTRYGSCHCIILAVFADITTYQVTRLTTPSCHAALIGASHLCCSPSLHQNGKYRPVCYQAIASPVQRFVWLFSWSTAIVAFQQRRQHQTS
jgi:hypothetical protein